MREARYHGVFAKLAQLNIYEDTSEELYGPALADFYNRFVGDFAGDIPVFERFLSGPSARTLDLACGSGRIAIGLARNGYTVDGLELSPDMLALAYKNLEVESVTTAARITLFEGDMTCFQLEERYDLIAIGVTSISLLLTAEERTGLFASVKKHLKPSGRFVFDFLDLSGDRWKQHDHHLDVWSAENEQGLDFALVGQRFYPNERTFTFNVYRECVGWDGSTQRSIGTSTKAWLDAEELVVALRASGLRVVDRFDMDQVTYLVADLAPEGDEG